MKSLSRGNPPKCLNTFKHGRDKWCVIFQNNLTDEIWEKLNAMQGDFCAYCECKLHDDNSKRHIEHFIQKDKDSSLTFDWNNLFGSCNTPNRCGKYKDESSQCKEIDLAKVCKPDISDPNKFLLFLNNGKVRPRSDLNNVDSDIAKNTIAVFNLDGDPSLENSRRASIQGEKALAEKYWEMMSDTPSDEFIELLKDELTESLIRVSTKQHSTPLEHLWKYNQGY